MPPLPISRSSGRGRGGTAAGSRRREEVSARDPAGRSRKVAASSVRGEQPLDRQRSSASSRAGLVEEGRALGAGLLQRLREQAVDLPPARRTAHPGLHLALRRPRRGSALVEPGLGAPPLAARRSPGRRRAARRSPPATARRRSGSSTTAALRGSNARGRPALVHRHQVEAPRRRHLGGLGQRDPGHAAPRFARFRRRA